MEFARKQLEKYGWTNGKGLGKHEDGISQALKPKLKRSMTGVGHDAASDFTEHWWSALYDKAASNIQVKEKDGTTKKIKTKDTTGFEITNSTWKLKRKKSKSSEQKPKEKYKDFFVRTAVLGSGGGKVERVKESESESEDDAERDVPKMTDEELFAACEGRTAHKGARHGVKALGKLARIAQQEQILLQQSRFNGYSHAKKLKENLEKEHDEEIVEDASFNSEEVTVKKRKKKKKHCLREEREGSADENNETKEINVDENSFNIKKKKKKKKSSNFDKKEIFDNGNTFDNDFEAVEDDVSVNFKRRKISVTINQNDNMNGGNINRDVEENELFGIDPQEPKRKNKLNHDTVNDSCKKSKKKKCKDT